MTNHSFLRTDCVQYGGKPSLWTCGRLGYPPQIFQALRGCWGLALTVLLAQSVNTDVKQMLCHLSVTDISCQMPEIQTYVIWCLVMLQHVF